MLTGKQETFALAVAKGMTQSDAYRHAYNVKKGTKDSSINVEASKLMANPEIYQRVESLRAPIAKKAQMTLEQHLDDLLELREMAKANGDVSAAIKAEGIRGKHSGVAASEKVAITNPIQVNIIASTMAPTLATQAYIDSLKGAKVG